MAHVITHAGGYERTSLEASVIVVPEGREIHVERKMGETTVIPFSMDDWKGFRRNLKKITPQSKVYPDGNGKFKSDNLDLHWEVHDHWINIEGEVLTGSHADDSGFSFHFGYPEFHYIVMESE